MQLRNRCGEPPLEARAISNPSVPVQAYEPELRQAQRWLGMELTRLGPDGDRFHVGVLDQLRNTLTAVDKFARGPSSITRPRDAEWSRLHSIGLISLVTLLIQEPGIPLSIPETAQTGTGPILTTALDLGDAKMPEDYQDVRLHVIAGDPAIMPANETDQWFREGHLWIRQVRPAQPTAFMQTALRPMGLDNLSAHGTLIPYLQAK